jgi:ADP-heptose:LPS heptosyltransferase
MKILVRRASAMGDVVTITPVLARLRAENPDAQIDVATACTAVFEGPNWKNPHVSNVVAFGSSTQGYDRVIDLDGIHELDRGRHAIDMYMERAFGDLAGPNDCHFPMSSAPPDLGVEVDWNRIVVLHANRSWQNRTLPGAFWQGLADLIQAAGWTIVVIGTSIDQQVTGSKVINTINRLNLFQQAAAMHHARVAIVGPGGIEQLAWCTDVPIVAFLTIVTEEAAHPWRHGEVGWNWFPIRTTVECRGCEATHVNVTSIGCNRGDFACIDTFTAEEAFAEVIEAIENDRRAVVFNKDP